MARQKYRTQYRVNKKGCECFRTWYSDEAYEKLAELSAKRPGVYTIQTRSYPVNKVGAPAVVDSFGNPSWSSWH